MKISCQSCQAKYTIADEKVLGKIVKIRCKKCGSTIVINGNESTATQAGAAGGGDGNVFDYAAQAGGGAEQWTVNVSDDDQRTLTVQDILLEYRAGVINDDTYCWKDGMADWLPLRDVPELYAAVSMAPQSVANPDFGGASADLTDRQSVQEEAAPPQQQHEEANGNGIANLFSSSAAEPAPIAARRQGGRAQGGDLFGGVAQAGGEDDVMTSAPVGTPEVHGDSKLTGQRNENSVLFSLAALTKEEDAPASKRGGADPGGPDGSGLIDIRALSASVSNNDSPKSKQLDDIMNLGGGGAFTAALAAPILAPPTMESAGASTQEGEKKSKGLLFALIGVGVLVVGLLVVVVMLLMKKPEAPVATKPTDAPATPAGAGDTTQPTAAAAAPTDTSNAAPPGTGNTAAKAPAVGTAAAAPVAPKFNAQPGAAAGGGAAAAPAAAPAPVAAAPTPVAASKPKSLADQMAGAVGTPPPAAAPVAAAGSDAPFDRGAAAAALNAVNAAACKKPDGPTGSGHVVVTFAPNGSVVSANVDRPPFAGTPVGGCIAGKYRSVRVPAFSGGNQPVGKSFIIN